MLYILIALLTFGFIVLVHEFGHFLLAKLNGIGVVEFSLGMGPRLCSFTKGETRYSIKLLPIGGSCMMVGEDAENPDPKAFNNKPVWARIAVIAAGPVFNFILAFLFAIVIVNYTGHDEPILKGVIENSPASEAGLQVGDRITRINNRKVSAYRDITLYMISHPGEPVTISYQRPAGGSWENGGASEKRSTVLTPQYNEEQQAYLMGVQFGNRKIQGIGEVLSCSAYEVKYCVLSTIEIIRMIARGKIKPNEALAGPVVIFSMVGDTVKESSQSGIMTVFVVLSNWILILSSTLGFMNLIPFPALDGGRLVFLFIELLRGKPVNPEKEGMVHLVGMMMLMALMVYVLFNDISRIIK